MDTLRQSSADSEEVGGWMSKRECGVRRPLDMVPLTPGVLLVVVSLADQLGADCFRGGKTFGHCERLHSTWRQGGWASESRHAAGNEAGVHGGRWKRQGGEGTLVRSDWRAAANEASLAAPGTTRARERERATRVRFSQPTMLTQRNYTCSLRTTTTLLAPW